MTPVGLPHSEIPGSKRACRSPRHIAACHVLHRLSVPRHPPSTLSNLTIKCLDLMRSAVPHSLKKRVLKRASLSTYPYSIVKELRVAQTNAECNPEIEFTARPAALVRRCGALVTGKKSGRPSEEEEMVELIGIEPTTLCLQSRCSPS